MRGRSLSLVVISSLLLPPSAAFAQEPDVDMGDDAPTEGDVDAPPAAVVKDPKLAKKWKDAGAQLVGKGDKATKQKKADEAKTFYENALTAYTNALASSDDLSFHYDIALVNDKLGRFDQAARHYRIVSKAAGVKPDIVKRATKNLDDATAKVGVVTLAVKPDEATVSLAGAEIGKSPLADPLFLMPGSYTFSFQADGYQPKDVEIAVEAGGETEKTVELEEIKVIVAPPEPDNEPIVPIATAEGPSKIPLIIGITLTVAAAGGAVVTGIMARSEHDTFVDPETDSDDREYAQDRGQNLALTTDILIGVGVAGALFTTGWYLFKYRPAKARHGEESSSPSPVAPTRAPSMTMAPWSNGTAGGFALGGTF